VNATHILKYNLGMPDRPSMLGLATFLAVAERKSFAAAAAVLGVSPSAVSQAVRALEEQLAVALLVRTTRSVRLTDAGAKLVAQAAPAVRQIDDAFAGVRDDVASGTLRINVPHIAVPGVIAPALPRLRARYPALSIDVVVEDRLADIVAEGYDAGVRLGEHVEREMVAIRVSPPFDFVVVGAPAYLKARGTPSHPRELVDHDCIGYRGPTSGLLYRWEFARRGKELAIAVTGSIVATDTALMVDAARQGLGLAYVDEHSAAPHLAAKRLVRVLADFAPRVPGFFLYFPRSARAQPKLRALIDVLRIPG